MAAVGFDGVPTGWRNVPSALHRASGQDDLRANLQRISTPEALDVMTRELACLASGRTEGGAEVLLRTLDGDTRHVSAQWRILPGFERGAGSCCP